LVNFAITVIAPPRYSHAAALREPAETVFHGLRALGHEVTIEAAPVPTEIPGARPIIFGAHLLPNFVPLPSNAIIYNLEQIGAKESPFVTPDYIRRLRDHEVWDYHAENIAALALHGITARLVPVGYVSELERIPAAEVEDIDVLFYGSVNDRRRLILTSLESRGVRVVGLFDAYGEDRDDQIARAKIVINVHFYPTQLFEIVRVSYLLTNRKCVVSEAPVPADLAEGVASTTYANIVDMCRFLLDDDLARKSIAAKGHAIMQARPEAEYLRQALDTLGPL
jgi:hypothetical protein